MLDVGDGQVIAWQESGRSHGKPVLVIHGGPGAGSSPEHRRAFDPDLYRIVQYDQRGCGASTPPVEGPGDDLSANTTWHLVADIERLRAHLGIGRWQVFGGSWGSTLALAYAESHPARVDELILRGVFAGRRSEIDWFYKGGVSAFHPEAWERLIEPMAVAGRAGTDVLETYADLLADPDPSVHRPAARAWTTSESMCASVPVEAGEIDRSEGSGETYATARLEHHYFVHGAWLQEDQLLRGAATLAAIPTVIVQGRCDMLTPPITAVELQRALPDARLELIDGAGHAFEEPGIVDALVRATDRFAHSAGEADRG
jgi:proline iminopeptidase